MLGELFLCWHVRVTVSRGVSYTLKSAFIELICCSTVVQSLVILSVNMSSGKGCGVSWIEVDEHASFFIWDEVGVFGFTAHREDSRIPCTA